MRFEEQGAFSQGLGRLLTVVPMCQVLGTETHTCGCWGHTRADLLGSSTLCPRCPPCGGALRTPRIPVLPAEATSSSCSPKASDWLPEPPWRGEETDIRQKAGG